MRGIIQDGVLPGAIREPGWGDMCKIRENLREEHEPNLGRMGLNWLRLNKRFTVYHFVTFEPGTITALQQP